MRATRAVALVLLLVAVAAGSWWFFGRHPAEPDSVVVYYTKADDGTTLVPWTRLARTRPAIGVRSPFTPPFKPSPGRRPGSMPCAFRAERTVLVGGR